MTAKEKIESLTNGWYGFAVFSAVFYVLRKGIGPISLMWNFASFLFALVFVFFIGRRLIAKGHLTRFILQVGSAIGTLAGTLGAGRMVFAFFGNWSFGLLLDAVAATVLVYMHARSFRVLTDKSVRAYFN